MNRHVVALFLLVGCADAPDLDGTASPSRAPEGTAEAIGVLALLNDAGTTLEVLDDAIGLDRRAAVSIVDHRDGDDRVYGTADDRPFVSIAEVDSLYYVGESALDLLTDWAWDHDFVPSEEDEILGSWDGVTFTVGEADAVVALANRAGADFLDDDLGLDSRAVGSILAARPVASVEHLADLYYVGEAALEALKAAAAACDVRPHSSKAFDAGDLPLWHHDVPAEFVPATQAGCGV